MIPQFAKYTADLYPEAIYDWMKMLYGISSFQRYWDDFFGIFSGNSRAAKKVNSLKQKLAKLENKASIFGKELEKYKSFELYDSLEDNGDPFPLLATLEPDEQNLPLRVCVAEMADEYCKYGENAFCGVLDRNECTEKNMAPQACRPEKCPFDKRGCKVVSVCMKPTVIEKYKKALKQ